MNRALRRAAERARPAPTRRADPTTATRLLAQCRPFDDGDMTHEHLITRAAFERLRDFAGDEGDFDRVGMILNIGLIRAEAIDPLLVCTMQRAADAMVRMRDRHSHGLRLGFDAAGLQDVPAALDAYEAICDASSPRQMTDAIQEAWRRIAGGDVLRVPI